MLIILCLSIGLVSDSNSSYRFTFCMLTFIFRWLSIWFDLVKTKSCRDVTPGCFCIAGLFSHVILETTNEFSLTAGFSLFWDFSLPCVRPHCRELPFWGMSVSTSKCVLNIFWKLHLCNSGNFLGFQSRPPLRWIPQLKRRSRRKPNIKVVQYLSWGLFLTRTINTASKWQNFSLPWIYSTGSEIYSLLCRVGLARVD